MIRRMIAPIVSLLGISACLISGNLGLVTLALLAVTAAAVAVLFGDTAAPAPLLADRNRTGARR
jgi:hypothetical protein